MLKRLFTFDNLITPSIIRLMFYVVVIVECLGALGVIITLLNAYIPVGLALLGIIGVIIGLLVVIVGARIGAELVLVLFMIRDELAWQRVNTPVPARV